MCEHYLAARRRHAQRFRPRVDAHFANDLENTGEREVVVASGGFVVRLALEFTGGGFNSLQINAKSGERFVFLPEFRTPDAALDAGQGAGFRAGQDESRDASPKPRRRARNRPRVTSR